MCSRKGPGNNVPRIRLVRWNYTRQNAKTTKSGRGCPPTSQGSLSMGGGKPYESSHVFDKYLTRKGAPLRMRLLHSQSSTISSLRFLGTIPRKMGGLAAILEMSTALSNSETLREGPADTVTLTSQAPVRRISIPEESNAGHMRHLI